MTIYESSRIRCPGAVIAMILLNGVSCPVLASAQAATADAGLMARAGLQHFALSDAQLGTIRGGMSLPDGISLTFGFQQFTTVNGTLVLSLLVPQIAITSQTISVPVYVYSATETPQISHSVATAAPSVSGGTVSAPATTGLTAATGTSFNQTSTQTSTPASTPPVTTTTTGGTLATKPAGIETVVPVSTPPISGTASGGTKYGVPVPTTTILATNASGDGATSVQTTFSGGGVLNGISNSLSNQIIQQTTLLNISVNGLSESTIAAQTASRVFNNVTRGYAAAP